MKNYTVYKHTNVVNNKVYVGITNQKPTARWNNELGYKTYYKNGGLISGSKYFYNAILKYGWGNFTHEILCESLNKREACEMEIKLIAEYKSNNREYGYNRNSGGSSVEHHTAKSKLKIGEASKGRRNTWKHVAVNQYDKQGDFIQAWECMRDVTKKLGIHHRDISKCCRGEGRIRSVGGYIWRYTTDLSPIRSINTKNNHRSKIIEQFDKDMNFIKRWSSIVEASKVMGVSRTAISRCCRGIVNTSGGYVWRYS